MNLGHNKKYIHLSFENIYDLVQTNTNPLTPNTVFTTTTVLAGSAVLLKLYQYEGEETRKKTKKVFDLATSGK